MAIEIDYGSAYVRSNGLKDYLALYELTFSQPSHPTSEQGFSTIDGTGYSAVVGGVTQNYSATYSDFQYAGSTTGLDGSGNPYVSAFIAQADQSGSIGKLVYTLFNLPTHTLFGDLNVVELGESLGKNYPDPVNKPTEFFYELGTTHVTISNLTSVLNEGVTGSPAVPIDWRTGSSPYDPYDISNNDVHNVVYPLMAGHGGNGSTSGLQHYFNLYGVVYNGAASTNEVFDSFNGNDTFNLNTGNNVVNFYHSGGAYFGNDVVNGFNSGDLLRFENDIFATDGAVISATSYNPFTQVSVTTVGAHTVTLNGLTSALTTSNVDVFA